MMPTGRTITAREAGVFLPGTLVIAKDRPIGTVIIPSREAMKHPHFDTDLYVRWDDGDCMWVGQSVLVRI